MKFSLFIMGVLLVVVFVPLFLFVVLFLGLGLDVPARWLTARFEEPLKLWIMLVETQTPEE